MVPDAGVFLVGLPWDYAILRCDTTGGVGPGIGTVHGRFRVD